jgi:alkylhydroperoxidase family enzyme
LASSSACRQLPDRSGTRGGRPHGQLRERQHLEHGRPLEALHAFTRGLLRNRGHLDADDVEALRKAGYTTEQALDVIAQAASTSMANWAANQADPPVDKPFQRQRWEAVAEAAVR